mmetsp:Transcript_65515/g.176998  ORF Transcript_65515/g.176998 Transcript_65515/m.176998 type:complete len:264 (+) Transcript_65515:1104-1895(+)
MSTNSPARTSSRCWPLRARPSRAPRCTSCCRPTTPPASALTRWSTTSGYTEATPSSSRTPTATSWSSASARLAGWRSGTTATAFPGTRAPCARPTATRNCTSWSTGRRCRTRAWSRRPWTSSTSPCGGGSPGRRRATRAAWTRCPPCLAARRRGRQRFRRGPASRRSQRCPSMRSGPSTRTRRRRRRSRRCPSTRSGPWTRTRRPRRPRRTRSPTTPTRARGTTSTRAATCPRRRRTWAPWTSPRWRAGSRSRSTRSARPRSR